MNRRDSLLDSKTWEISLIAWARPSPTPCLIPKRFPLVNRSSVKTWWRPSLPLIRPPSSAWLWCGVRTPGGSFGGGLLLLILPCVPPPTLHLLPLPLSTTIKVISLLQHLLWFPLFSPARSLVIFLRRITKLWRFVGVSLSSSNLLLPVCSNANSRSARSRSLRTHSAAAMSA